MYIFINKVVLLFIRYIFTFLTERYLYLLKKQRINIFIVHKFITIKHMQQIICLYLNIKQYNSDYANYSLRI